MFKIFVKAIIISLGIGLPLLIGLLGYGLGLSLSSSKDNPKFVPVVNAITPEVPNRGTNKNFELEIPSIGLRKDIGHNVDVYDQDLYEVVLSSRIAHAKHSLSPSDFLTIGSGVVYLFAHREGEANFFSNLDSLSEGDLVYVYEGDYAFVFRVMSSKILPAYDTSSFLSHNNQQILRLQTCENGEIDRLIVDSVLVEIRDL
jgi:LPXTG-site transpeptidase (sortase) family protein